MSGLVDAARTARALDGAAFGGGVAVAAVDLGVARREAEGSSPILAAASSLVIDCARPGLDAFRASCALRAFGSSVAEGRPATWTGGAALHVEHRRDPLSQQSSQT